MSQPFEPFSWVAFFVGVASSAAFALLVWLLRAGKEKLVREWGIRLAMEQLVDISGRWNSEEVSKDRYSYRETMDLNQRGMKIEGKLTYIEVPTDPAATRTEKVFSVTGVYRERTLTAYYRTDDPHSTSSGCLTLHLVNDNRMEGGCVYYEGDVAEVVFDPYGWELAK